MFLECIDKVDVKGSEEGKTEGEESVRRKLTKWDSRDYEHLRWH